MAGPRRSRAAKSPLDCHERALRLLAVRPRSRRELRDRLLRAGFETAEVDEELERLESVGLIDDERFAREFTEHQLGARLAGRRAVRSALAAKGLDRGTIEAVLDEANGDEAERAEKLARERARRLAGVAPEKAYARLVSFLVRRGHEPEMARRAARTALALQGDEG